MKIAICDDDNGACEELRKILENISTEKDMIHIYNAGEELLGDISSPALYICRLFGYRTARSEWCGSRTGIARAGRKAAPGSDLYIAEEQLLRAAF